MLLFRNAAFLACTSLIIAGCYSAVSTTDSRNTSSEADAGDKLRPLSLDEAKRIDEIASIMKLSDQEKVILTDLMERNHPAVKPLHKLITEMEGRLAPYLKEKWILFSDHVKALEREIAEKKSANQRVEGLTQRYEQELARANNLDRKTSVLLGYVDSENRPLNRIEIVGIGVDAALTTAKVLANEATSFRALASYEGSLIKRDVSMLASWMLVSPDSAVRQNPISPYVLSAGDPSSGERSLKAYLGPNGSEKSHQIPISIVAATSVTYEVSVLKFIDENALAEVPVGLIARLQTVAIATDHNNREIGRFDISDSVTWNRPEGAIAPPRLERVQSRKGVFAASAKRTLQFSSSLNGKTLTKNVNVVDPVVVGYVFKDTGGSLNDYDRLESTVLCEGESVFGYGSGGAFAQTTFTGEQFETPKVLKLASDCSKVEVGDTAFVIPSQPGAIQRRSDRYVANEPTTPVDQPVEVRASLNNTNLDTFNKFYAHVVDRKLTAISTLPPGNEFWRANKCYVAQDAQKLAVDWSDDSQLFNRLSESDYLDPTTDGSRILTVQYFGKGGVPLGISAAPAGAQFNREQHVDTRSTGISYVEIGFSDFGLVRDDGTFVNDESLSGKNYFSVRSSNLLIGANNWQAGPEIAFKVEVVPGNEYDKVRLTFENPLANGIFQVTVKANDATRFKSARNFYVGQGSKVFEQLANYPFASFPDNYPMNSRRLAKLALYVTWNGCKTDALVANNAGLPAGITGLQVRLQDGSGNANPAKYEFGRRWNALSLYFDQGETQAQVKIDYDFSALCYNPTVEPTKCRGLGLTPNSFLTDPFEMAH